MLVNGRWDLIRCLKGSTFVIHFLLHVSAVLFDFRQAREIKVLRRENNTKKE